MKEGVNSSSQVMRIARYKLWLGDNYSISNYLRKGKPRYGVASLYRTGRRVPKVFISLCTQRMDESCIGDRMAIHVLDKETQEFVDGWWR